MAADEVYQITIDMIIEELAKDREAYERDVHNGAPLTLPEQRRRQRRAATYCNKLQSLERAFRLQGRFSSLQMDRLRGVLWR